MRRSKRHFRQLREIFPEMSDRQIREAYRRNQLMGQTE
ncbi:MAG TPA: hypothetical protein EYM25_05925 [Deltaproteobacteria bacterium]|nr:hypothetical protein [Deltaproteobacteria bacterium]